MSSKKEIRRILLGYTHFLMKSAHLENHIDGALNEEIQQAKEQLDMLDHECPAGELREASKAELQAKIKALGEMQATNKEAMVEAVNHALTSVYKKITDK